MSISKSSEKKRKREEREAEEKANTQTAEEIKENKDKKEKKEKKDKKEKKGKEEKASKKRKLDTENENTSGEQKLETICPSASSPSMTVEDFPVLTHFSECSFPQFVKDYLKVQGFETPTPIQAKGLPISFSGRDLIGLAETGSGKTLAYMLPAVVHILDKFKKPSNSHKNKNNPYVLVLAPTRELAIQIQDVCEKLLSSKTNTEKISSIVIYGGVPKTVQANQIKTNGPKIVVATPGRLIDLLEDGTITVAEVSYLVFDEADRMLDLGFEPQIRRIMANIKTTNRQTAMFSATWPKGIQRLAEDFLTNPLKVVIGSEDITANQKVSQIVEVVSDFQKKGKLLDFLRQATKNKKEKEKILVFILYKKSAGFMMTTLQTAGYNAIAIHGDKSQSEREAALEAFKNGTSQILVATDVAARGLDIPDVKYVINYEFPLTIEDYVHRIGRTGRAGKSGTAYTLFTEQNKEFSAELYKVLSDANQQVPPKLDEWKFFTHKTQKRTGFTDMYGKGNWEVKKTLQEQKTHIKFDD